MDKRDAELAHTAGLLHDIGRFALPGAALLVTIFVVRLDALGVLLGFSIVVVGIMGEAVYAMYRSFAD